MLDRWMDRVPALHGDLTTLREVAASDVHALFTLFSDPAVTAYMAPPPPTLAKFAGFVEWSHRQRAQGHGVCFGIVPAGMTAAVGILQVRLEPTLSGAEWGFVLSAHFWSTGMFADAADVLVKFAFTTLLVERLEARIALRNRRARAAVQKLGARFDDHARVVVTTGHSARPAVGVEPAGTRLAEPVARSGAPAPDAAATDPAGGRSGGKRVAAKRGARDSRTVSAVPV